MAVIHTGSTERPRPEIAAAMREYEPADMSFIAGRVMPEIEVTEQAGSLTIVGRGDILRIEKDNEGNFSGTSVVVAPGATYGRLAIRTEVTTYHCPKQGKEASLTDEERKTYPSLFEGEVFSAQVAALQLMLNREVRVASALFNTTTWDSSDSDLFTDKSGSPWTTASNDIVNHVIMAADKVRKNTGYRPNTLIIGAGLEPYLIDNDEVIARYPGTDKLTVEKLRANMASIFGLQNLFVGDAVYNQALEGQDEDVTDVWSSSYAMVGRIVRDQNPKLPALGRSLRWTAVSGEGIDVSSYREPQSDSDVYKVREFLDELVLDKYQGHLIQVQ